MSFCPNKSSKSYKSLVSQLGETNAYNAWFLHNKEILTGKKSTSVKSGVEELFESNQDLANAVYEALGFDKQINEIGDTKKVNEYIKKYKEALPNIKDGKTLISHLQTVSYRNAGTTKQFADLIIKLSKSNKGLETLLNNPNLYAKPNGVGDEGAFHWSLFNDLSVNKIVLELDHFKTNTYDDVFLHELIHNLTTQFIVKDSDLFNQSFYNKTKELYSVFDNYLESNRKVNEPLLKSTKEDVNNLKEVLRYFTQLPSDAIQHELIFGKIGSVSTIKGAKLDFKSLENKSKQDVLKEIETIISFKESRIKEIEKGDKDYYYFNSKTFKQENVLSEFLATFINDINFREQLKNIEYKNNKSLFQKIIDLFSEFLGLTKNDSLYNEFVLTLTNFINNNDYSSIAKQTVKTAYQNRIDLLEQQKQQAQQLYSQYLEQGGSKQDIEGFKEFVKNPIVEPIIPTVEQAKELLSDIQKPKVQFSIDEEYKSLYEKYGDVISKSLPYKKAIDTAFTINKVFKSIIARVYGDEDTGYRITIERKELVNVQQKVLDKMKSLFPKIRRKVISMQEAVNMVGENAYKANAFILDNIVYFIDGKITDETVIEEFLHPFIEYLYQYNKSLFDNLYEEASQDKELKRSVIDRYSKVTKNVNDIKKELVTQKLTQLLNYELKNVPERKIEETKSLIKKVFDQLSNFFYKILGGKQKLDAIILPPKLSLGTLAQIINTENLELPVSFTYQPMFSLLDDVQTQSRAQGLYIDGDNYKDKNGTIYERLTEWVRNVLSTKEKSLSIEEWAALEAKRRFQNGNTNLNASGVEVLKQPDGSEITLEDLTREILIDFNTSRAFGTIAHLIIDKSIKEKMGEDVTELSLKIQAEAEGKPDQNAIDLKRLNWIKDNIESILLLTGTNALDSRVDKDKRDKILSEIKYSFEPLGIATTIDGLIQHSDGRLSIKDWKTGNLLSDSLRPYLMNEFSRQIENIIDSKLDRAKAEVVLRAMMIKYNNPAAKFRQLSIEQLNRSNLVETHNINLEAFLPMLEEFFKDKNPEAYQKMKAKNLFDPLEYSLMPVVDEKSAVNVQERIEELDKEILLTKNRMIQEKSSYFKNQYKQKLEDLTRERLELAGMASIDLTEQKSELGFWKRHFGKLGNMSNPIYRTYKMLIDKAKMLMITEEKALFNEFDKLQEKLMKEYDSRPGNIGLKYKTADGSGLYDFMWVKKNKSGAIGYYRITEKDAEWDTLTETQKAYVKFFSESLSKLYNEVAKQKVFITATGQELNNAEFSKVDFGTELPEDFMPRVYMDFGEYMSHFGVGKTAALEYHKFKNKYLRTDFYANNANEVLPFKFLGNAAIIGTGNYTFNAERAYKEFAKNLLRKKHLDKIQAIGNGISVIFGNNDWEFDKQFINDRIMVEVTGMKRKTDFSQSKYSSLRKIEKYGFDFDAILGGLKEIVTAGTMWLKPFAGLRNGVYTLMTNHKNAVSRSIAKRVGVPPEELDFTESDLIKADKLWMQYYYDIIAGKEEENKLHLLLKQYNYLPDAYDFRVIKSKLISEKNKFMNSDYLYFFHSIFEDWGTGSIFTALMLHNKHNGKSLYDSYTVKDGQLVWEGGVRGKRADGSEITSLTYEELNKFKSISAMIHGNYRDDEKGAIELYAWGRLIMQFKRFVPQQLINLLQSRQMSYSFGQWKEMLDQNNNKLMVWEPQIIRGRMALMFDFLIKGTAFTAQGQKYWDSLSNREKQDLVAGLFTLLISYMGGLLATIAFDDDEEEKWIAQSWIKVFRDLSEGMRPIDLIENFRYSSVSVHKLYNLTKAVTEFSYGIATGEVNKYGEYKGSNEIAKTLPFFSTVYDIDRALNNTRTGKNVGLNIFNADNYNWDIDQIK